MEPIGGPDAKKARWSPSSSYAAQSTSNNNNNSRDAFVNYGYGPQASISQAAFNTAPGGPTTNGAAGFASSPLYSTPSLSVNTQSNGGMGMGSQMSPNTAAAAFAVQQQQQQQQHHQHQQAQAQAQQQQQQQAQGSSNGNYSPFNAYNMLGMGMPSMGILSPFTYNNQMGNFAQVNQKRICSSEIKLNSFSEDAFAQYQHPKHGRLLPCCPFRRHERFHQRYWSHRLRR
jgi:hypothetical protein